jgi:hypothetical protein
VLTGATVFFALGSQSFGDVPPSRGVPLIGRTADSSGVRHIPVGFNDNTYDGNANDTAAGYANNLAWYQGAHATVARLTINWAYSQWATGSKESWYFDNQAKNWLDHGIKVLFTVVGAPSWAYGTNDSCSPTPWCPPGDDPTHLREYTVFMADLTRHVTGIGATVSDNPYSPGEAANVAGIEIWNEPNLRWAWPTKMGPDAARYTRLLVKAYSAVKAVAVSVPVLGGAVSNDLSLSQTAGDQSLHDFLSAALSDGASTHMDGLSFHAYDSNSNPITDPPPPLPATDLLDQTIRTNVKSVLQGFTEKGQPLNGRLHLWITEMGASTTGGCLFPLGWHTCTQQDQSDDIRQDYHQYDSNFPDVDAMFIHTLQDPSDSPPGYGLILAQPPMNSPPGTVFTYKCAYTNLSYDLQQLGFPGTPVAGPVACPTS